MNVESGPRPKLSQYPIAGKFGPYGGCFVPETLMPALQELEAAYQIAKADPAFQQQLHEYRVHYGGRPTPLFEAKRLSAHFGGAQILLKREDLVHGGAHQFNNAMGQALLARRLGKTRLIAESGAGSHGVATAMVAAMLGVTAEIYMGTTDMERQKHSVYLMQLLGAKVHPVGSGSATLKDALGEALCDWEASLKNTHYLMGSAVGPHPYPLIVRDFQAVIGGEIKGQILRQCGRMPNAVVACVGAGGNAIGTFHPFVEDADVQLLGAQAAGTGDSGAACLSKGAVGVLHGAKSYVRQDAGGQILLAHSVSPDLDYPAVGPEHAMYKDAKRAEYVSVNDEQALEGFRWLCRFEGILPALESAHAVYAGAMKAKALSSDKLVVITICGRGDKDVDTVYRLQGAASGGIG